MLLAWQSLDKVLWKKKHPSNLRILDIDCSAIVLWLFRAFLTLEETLFTVIEGEGCSGWWFCAWPGWSMGCKSMYFLTIIASVCINLATLTTQIPVKIYYRLPKPRKERSFALQRSTISLGPYPHCHPLPQVSWKQLSVGEASWGHPRALQEAPLSPHPKGLRYLDSCLTMNGTLWQKN